MARNKKNNNVPEKLPLHRLVFRTKDGENTTIGGTRVSDWGVEGYLGYWDGDEEAWVPVAKLVYADGSELEIGEGYLKYFYKGTDEEALGLAVSCAESDMERNEKWAK